MSNNIIIEMAPFQVSKGVSDEMLLEASNILQREFLSKQKGFIKRELLKSGEYSWVDMVYWESSTDAEKAMRNASHSKTSYSYFQLMDLSDQPQGAFHFVKMTEY